MNPERGAGSTMSAGGGERPDPDPVGAEVLRHVCVVGPGRLGLAIGGHLAETGRVADLTFVGRSATTPDHPVFSTGRADYTNDPRAVDSPTLVLVAVPDREIPGVASALANALAAPGEVLVPVLHTSGAQGPEVLRPLRERGHPVGWLHPLVAVADSRDRGGRLIGAWYGIGGDPVATRAADRLVSLVKGQSLRVDSSKRPAYHAAAVFASNYVVALLAVAEDLMVGAGVDPRDARQALADLARGAIDAVAARSPAAALTGPISRGDDVTVGLHLRGLSAEGRQLYSGLGQVALELARLQGLGPEAADRIASALKVGGS